MGRGGRRGLTMVAPAGDAIQAAAQLPERRRDGGRGGEVRDWFVSCWADLIGRREEGSRNSDRARPSLAQPGVNS